MTVKRKREGTTDILVDANWVADVLSAHGKTPSGSPDVEPKAVVLLEILYLGDVRAGGADNAEDGCIPGGADNAEDGCIPGAISVHPSYFEAEWATERYYPNYTCAQDGNLLPDDQLRRAIANLGIREDSLVVVYGRGAPAAPMAACRALWALMYAGVRDVRLLDGGFEAWKKHGGHVAKQPKTPTAAAHFGAQGKCIQRYLATTVEVADVVSGKRPGTLVDVRKAGEHDGSFADNYTFFRRSGHIPRTIYLGDWTELVDVGTGKLKNLQGVRSRWESLGLLSAEGPLIFYCGTGWRSSIAFLLAFSMGLEAKNYDDGFYGWTEAGHEVCTKVPPEGCTGDVDASRAVVSPSAGHSAAEIAASEPAM